MAALPSTTASRLDGSCPWWLTAVLIPLLQLSLAFAVVAMVLFWVGEDPVSALTTMLQGALDPQGGLSATLYYSTSLIFTGLAVAVAFHAGLFNLGGEGQAYVAGLGVILACLWLDQTLGPIAMFFCAMLSAMLFGAAWAFIPAVLQARRGAHIVVTTIMFNYLAAALLNYMLVGPLRADAGLAIESRAIAATALLPKVHEWLGAWGLPLHASFFNLSFFLALLCVVGVWWLLWRTRLGYALRALGHNARAARYAGLHQARLCIIAMFLSGALAGLMAVNNVYGGQGRLLLNFTGGMGFLGIAVALMGRNQPLGIVAASLLFGALLEGSVDLQLGFARISPELILLIQGVIIFFVAALDQLIRKPVERGYLRLQTAQHKRRQ